MCLGRGHAECVCLEAEREMMREQEEEQAMNAAGEDFEGYGFMEADRPMTPDERRREIVRFLCWLIDNTRVDAILLADTSGSGQLRQVLDEDEFVALVQEWEQAEVDEACAATERAYERHSEWG